MWLKVFFGERPGLMAIITRDGTVYFSANDVCKMCEYDCPRYFANRHSKCDMSELVSPCLAEQFSPFRDNPALTFEEMISAIEMTTDRVNVEELKTLWYEGEVRKRIPRVFRKFAKSAFHLKILRESDMKLGDWMEKFVLIHYMYTPMSPSSKRRWLDEFEPCEDDPCEKTMLDNFCKCGRANCENSDPPFPFRLMNRSDDEPDENEPDEPHEDDESVHDEPWSPRESNEEIESSKEQDYPSDFSEPDSGNYSERTDGWIERPERVSRVSKKVKKRKVECFSERVLVEGSWSSRPVVISMLKRLKRKFKSLEGDKDRRYQLSFKLVRLE